MSQDDVAVLVCGTLVLGFTTVVTVVCSVIVYRGLRDFTKSMKAFDRRMRFKVIDGGRGDKYNIEHERDSLRRKSDSKEEV